MADNSIYDFTKDFKTECLPEIIKLKQFCVSRGIPFYMTFATKNSKSGTDYMTIKQIPPEVDVKLADDMIRKIILAERGFDLAMNHVDTFDMEWLPRGHVDPTQSTQNEDIF